MLSSQIYIFFIFIMIGVIIGIIFDIFRILRRSFYTGLILTALEDIMFWILIGALIVYSIFAFNNGVIRGYMFLGITIRCNTVYINFKQEFYTTKCNYY